MAYKRKGNYTGESQDGLKDLPVLIRASDPYIVRLSPFAIAVNDTVYYAKIKEGIMHNGYEIYCSGIGEPIWKDLRIGEDSTNTSPIKDEEPTNTTTMTITSDTNGDVQMTRNKTSFTSNEINAIRWIDMLEDSLTVDRTRVLTDAIDDLTCQLHMDITGRTNLYKMYYTEKGEYKENIEVNAENNETYEQRMRELHHIDIVGEERVTYPNKNAGDSLVNRLWYTPSNNNDIQDTYDDIRNTSGTMNTSTLGGTVSRAVFIEETNILNRMYDYLFDSGNGNVWLGTLHDRLIMNGDKLNTIDGRLHNDYVSFNETLDRTWNGFPVVSTWSATPEFSG